MTRRELAKFLTLGSGLLASVNVLIAFIGLNARIPTTPIQRIAGTADDPARRFAPVPLPDGGRSLHPGARRLGPARRLLAGLHASLVRGRAPAGRTGAGVSVPQGIVLLHRRPAAGRAADAPPAAHRDRAAGRRDRGDRHRGLRWRPAQQGSTLFSAVLVLIAILVVIQLWLVAAAVDALMARQTACWCRPRSPRACCSR